MTGPGDSRPQAVIAGVVACLAVCVHVSGCSTLPPGSEFPKTASLALPHAETTRLGSQFAGPVLSHGGDSAFRIITVGVDGFLARAQMIDTAERTLDLQYYIFRGDETGRMLTDALLRAADRGVRVRVLIDDGDTVAGDEQVLALDAHPAVEVRVFNPFAYRGHLKIARLAEFLFNRSRLDYRMHNKLMVVDNTVALVGGRNIGNQYFQMDPESQFADDDVFAAGPVAGQLSTTFDEYWNSAFSIPAEALQHRSRSSSVADYRTRPPRPLAPLQDGGIDYAGRVASGEPYAGMVSGRLPLVWSHAQVVCDSPDKKNVESGILHGRLMARTVAAAAAAARSEVLLVTPYYVPAADQVQLMKAARQRSVRVRILTNSLESSLDVVAHSGYIQFRQPLLKDGAELNEIRSLLGNSRGSGQTTALSRFGNYSLHAKLFVFDRQRVFIGSMNFDQRSKRLNTEVGLIIDSPDLARQTAVRFDAMTQPQNSYVLGLDPEGVAGRQKIVWRTDEGAGPVDYRREPARSEWQRFLAWFFSLLPLEAEL
jgi:putative cardiolipin synthase